MALVAEVVGRTVREGRRSYPVAAHLALFAIGTLTPVLLIVTWMMIDAARLRRDDSLHDAGTAVRHLNATIEVEIQKSIAVGQTLATSRALADGDYATFDGQARDVGSRLGLVIVSRDITGQQRTSTAAAPGKPLPFSNPGIIAIDRQAAEQRAPVVSDLVTGTVMRTWLVIADVPVIKDNAVVAFVDVVLRPQRIGEILAQDLPAGWIAGVIGRDGRLIARSVDQDRYIGTINHSFADSVTGWEGTWTGISREGTAISGWYVRSTLSGWTVSVAVPEAVLHAPALWAMGWVSGLTAAALAASLWLGWRLSRRISLPMHDLVGRARDLGEGRRPAETHSSVGEVNHITEALLAAWSELDLRADAARQAAAAVRANEERLQLVQETAGIGTIDWDMETGLMVCSARFYELYSLPAGRPVRLSDIMRRVHPADRSRVAQLTDRTFAQGGPFQEEFRVMTSTGDESWLFASGRLDMTDGKPVRLLAANIDITERKRSEDHLRFLLREISHRSKNLLAVIQAMAGQTARTAETVEVFRRRFGERLMGLAASHDLLVNQDWLGASVDSLVRGQLASFVDANDPRVSISGPNIDLKADAAQTLGLALHELATNSLKYGALRDTAGTVAITWAVTEPDAAGEWDERRFRMDWIEHASDPVQPPSHKGFGRIVIEHTVEAVFNGTVALEFPPGGLRWSIEAPVTCLAPTATGLAA